MADIDKLFIPSDLETIIITFLLKVYFYPLYNYIGVIIFIIDLIIDSLFYKSRR